MNTSKTTGIKNDFDFTVDDEYKRQRKAENNLRFNDQNREHKNAHAREMHNANKDVINEDKRANYQGSDTQIKKQVQYQENPEEFREKTAERYVEKREDILEKQKDKTICECGVQYTTRMWKRHFTSDNHLKYEDKKKKSQNI